MTKEDKELLLKDLCARLPYGVKINNEIQGDFTVYGICENFIYGRTEVCHADFPVEKIKPYLFPLSSMTKEQKKEYAHILVLSSNLAYSQLLEITIEDWLNKHHFDYRGLIPKGIAKDATNLNIY